VSSNAVVTGLLTASGGITGPTGSFTNIAVSGLLTASGGITGPTGSFTNIAVSSNAVVNGNVGIGKSYNSNYALDVSGNIHIGNTGTNGIYFQDGSFQNTSSKSYNSSFMVAGGGGNTVLAYSYDGINWVTSTNGSTILASCSSVIYNGALWVAGGSPKTTGATPLAYSSDGITWTAANSGSAVLSSCVAVAWNGAVWVAGGTPATNGQAIAYSYDGKTWYASANGTTALGVDASANIGAICASNSNNLFVAGSGVPNFNSAYASYSYDGINWTKQSIRKGAYGNINNIAYNGNIWLLTTSYANSSQDPYVYYSYDGINWNSSLSPTSGSGNLSAYSPVWTGNIWVLGGYLDKSANILYESTDGINWSPNSNSTSIWSTNVTSLGWNGSILTATGAKDSTIINAYGYISQPNTALNYITFTSNSNANTLFPSGISTYASKNVPNYIIQSKPIAWSYDASLNLFTSSSKVGIGKSYPQYPLDVSGNAYSSGNFISGSDYRIKENIQLLDENFVVDHLRPVTYKHKLNNKKDIGFIAHEVQEYYPYLVSGEKDGEQMQGISYNSLIPILVKEIKDLKNKVQLMEDFILKK
jgi:hypothetical protein